MIRAGRCRHPGVVFEHVDGELVGLIPSRFGVARFGSRTTADPITSKIGLQLAIALFGKAAAAGLVGLTVGSLPAYQRGSRVLPQAKVVMLQSAIRIAARLVTAQA